MSWEYKVVEERLGSPQTLEADLNEYASQGWEFYAFSILGPIPSRWLVFRRPPKQSMTQAQMRGT
ncbi:MAG: hypothetical protein C5B60_07075 [Chloroflexi bacterium]|nr:MAG: hypothetical protein C5B60_07075 [Chloroflexota bacterium]